MVLLVIVANKKKQNKKTKRTDGSGCSRVQGLGFGFRISVRVRAWARESTSCVFVCFFLWCCKCGGHLRLRWFGKCTTDNL